MTRRTMLWIATIAAALLLPCVALAATPINETTFPDANFRAIALANYSDGSGNVDDSVTVIDVNDKNIRDLTGIAYYTALTDLYCITNQLTALDVSNNTALTMLVCFRNSLTTLNVSSNLALKYLDCSQNLLTALDVSNNTALVTLFCASNQLTTLDVSNNTALADLFCLLNQLTSLDLSNNTNLSTTNLADQNAGPITYTLLDKWYRVNLTELPHIDLTDISRITITDGGLLDSATGNVYYASPPSTVQYDYDTHNAGSGGTLMSVIVSVIPPASAVPQTGDGSRPVLWLVLSLLAAAGLRLIFRKPHKA